MRKIGVNATVIVTVFLTATALLGSVACTKKEPLDQGSVTAEAGQTATQTAPTTDSHAESKNEARVEFLEPIDGAKVGQKFRVRMNVEGYEIGPLGDLTKGKGHHHIVINGTWIKDGEVIPADEKHVHFGKGQTETELELKPGKYSLTLQFADGAHRSYGEKLSQTINITVQ